MTNYAIILAAGKGTAWSQIYQKCCIAVGFHVRARFGQRLLIQKRPQIVIVLAMSSYE